MDILLIQADTPGTKASRSTINVKKQEAIRDQLENILSHYSPGIQESTSTKDALTKMQGTDLVILFNDYPAFTGSQEYMAIIRTAHNHNIPVIGVTSHHNAFPYKNRGLTKVLSIGEISKAHHDKKKNTTPELAQQIMSYVS